MIRDRADNSRWTRRGQAATAIAVALTSIGAFPGMGIRAAADDDDGLYTVVKTRKAITVSGEEISDAIIVIKDRKIDAVGKNVKYPSESRVIDARESIVMPGMINPYARIGDAAEAPGGFRPGGRGPGAGPGVGRGGSGNRSNVTLSGTFYPPEDDVYRKLLAAGYTAVALYPDGSGLPGQFLVLHTHEPAAKSKGIKNEGVLRVTFSNPQRDKRIVRDAFKAAADAIEAEKRPATQSAPAPRGAAPGGMRPTGGRPGMGGPPGGPTTGPAPAPTTGPTTGPATAPTTTAATQPTTQPATQPAVRPELVPLIALLKKQAGRGAIIEFGRASDAVHFADAMADYEFARAYLFAAGTPDLNYAVDNPLFGEAKALVALTPGLRNMPLTVNPYNAAKRFVDAGCAVAFYPASDRVEDHERMRESLAFMVRNGVSRADALKSVTLHPARMLQLDKELGSIEKDRRADLVFLDGDPLDPFSRVEKVMIGGTIVFESEDAR